MKKVVVILSVIFLFLPVLALSKSQKSPIDPHLQLFEKRRASLRRVALETGDKQTLGYLESFVSESIKTRPASFDRWLITELIPGDHPSEKEWFKVVIVLDSDCKLPGIQKNICQDIKGAGVLYGPPGSCPMLVIRDVQGVSDFESGIELAGAMVFLEETSDAHPSPKDLTAKEARAFEQTAKEKDAYDLRLRLSIKHPK